MTSPTPVASVGSPASDAAKPLPPVSNLPEFNLHPELTGIDLDVLLEPFNLPPIPAPDVPAVPAVGPVAGFDIDALIGNCSAEELQKLETDTGAVFQACSYSSCTITNHITINVVKK